MSSETNNVQKDDKILCNAKVIFECCSEALKPTVLSGAFHAYVPVLFSENRVTFTIESKIKFPKHIFEIRHCQRTAHITQCKLLDHGNLRYGNIFINGFIRESIEYLEVNNIDTSDFSGKIRFIDVNTPFECSAKIEYMRAPKLQKAKCFIPIQINPPTTLHAENINNTTNLSDNLFDTIIFELKALSIDNPDNTLSVNNYPDNSALLSQYLIVSVTFMLLQKQLINFKTGI